MNKSNVAILAFIIKTQLAISLNSVRVHVRAFEIVVDDDGPGIPKENREQVFQPFYRQDTARNLDEGGTGLGLSIVRDAVRSHGGRIRLDQSPYGGLRVVLTFPRS